MSYYVVFTISVIVCSVIVAVHLDRRTIEREMIGDITKCFLIPTLYFTLFTASKAFPRVISRPYIIILITVFYTLGDILLLKKKPFRRFVAGALSFSAGHMCYVIYFSFYGLNIYTLLSGMVIFGIPYFLIVKYVFTHQKSVKHGYGVLLYAFTLYLFAVGMSAVFSFEYLKTSILVIIGVMLFMFSDSRIALNAMSGSNTHSSFVIMLTYILANLFLVLGVWCINVPVAS